MEKGAYMQYVRVITKEDLKNKNSKGTLYYEINVSIMFEKKEVMIWNGAYWETTPFEDLFCIATFDAPVNYED